MKFASELISSVQHLTNGFDVGERLTARFVWPAEIMRANGPDSLFICVQLRICVLYNVYPWGLRFT